MSTAARNCGRSSIKKPGGVKERRGGGRGGGGGREAKGRKGGQKIQKQLLFKVSNLGANTRHLMSWRPD